MSFKEITISVRGISLSAKLWHPDAKINVIGLHGWLDNAGSFDLLAPRLPTCRFLALDQAGTGLSDFRPESSTYHLWDDLLDLLAVIDDMHWEKVTLIGHSRGAMLACLFASCFPEKINQVILLDGLMPLPVKAEDCVNQLKSFLHNYSKAMSPWRYYNDRKTLIRLRAKSGAIPEKSANILAKRAIHKDDNGYYWRVDRRLKYASAIKFADTQVAEIVNTLDTKIHVMLAGDGLLNSQYVSQVIKGNSDKFSLYHLTGHHHFHLDNEVEEIARLCTEIL